MKAQKEILLTASTASHWATSASVVAIVSPLNCGKGSVGWSNCGSDFVCGETAQGTKCFAGAKTLGGAEQQQQREKTTRLPNHQQTNRPCINTSAYDTPPRQAC